MHVSVTVREAEIFPSNVFHQPRSPSIANFMATSSAPVVQKCSPSTQVATNSELGSDFSVPTQQMTNFRPNFRASIYISCFPCSQRATIINNTHTSNFHPIFTTQTTPIINHTHKSENHISFLSFHHLFHTPLFSTSSTISIHFWKFIQGRRRRNSRNKGELTWILWVFSTLFSSLFIFH